MTDLSTLPAAPSTAGKTTSERAADLSAAARPVGTLTIGRDPVSGDYRLAYDIDAPDGMHMSARLTIADLWALLEATQTLEAAFGAGANDYVSFACENGGAVTFTRICERFDVCVRKANGGSFTFPLSLAAVTNLRKVVRDLCGAWFSVLSVPS
jgi:hypothetical protein